MARREDIPAAALWFWRVVTAALALGIIGLVASLVGIDGAGFVWLLTGWLIIDGVKAALDVLFAIDLWIIRWRIRRAERREL